MSAVPPATANPPASYYADSSALVKRHVQEIGSSWVRSLADPATGNVVITAQLSVVEVFSAFNRRRRELNISATDYALLAADFVRVVSGEYEIVPFTPDVIDCARLLLERYMLRAGDAVQLASAMLANNQLQATGFAPLKFISSDERLLVIAQAENLVTNDPRLHP